MQVLPSPAIEGTTRDTLWGGRLVFWQPPRGRGYRFNIDPVLLADFISPTAHVIDIGTGVGVLGILLLAMGRVQRVTAVEVQPELAELALRNARENGFVNCFEVIVGDCRAVPIPSADAVVFNPPYFRQGEGRPAPDQGRDWARHERNGTLADFVARGCAAAAPSGRLAAIVPARRGDELVRLLESGGCGGLRKRFVHPRADAPAGHLLVEAHIGSAWDSTQEPPLVVHGPQGRDFSVEVRRILRES